MFIDLFLTWARTFLYIDRNLRKINWTHTPLSCDKINLYLWFLEILYARISVPIRCSPLPDTQPEPGIELDKIDFSHENWESSLPQAPPQYNFRLPWFSPAPGSNETCYLSKDFKELCGGVGHGGKWDPYCLNSSLPFRHPQECGLGDRSIYSC